MRRPLIVACASAVLALAACGGSSSPGGNASGGMAGSAPTVARSAGGARAGRRPARSRARTQGSRPSAAAKATLGRAAFIRRADRVCRRTHIQVGAIGRALAQLGVALQRRKLSVADYFARTATLTSRSAAIVRRAVATLSALAAHRSEAALKAYLRATATQAQLLSAQAAAVRRRDVQRARALNAQLASTGARVHAAAKRFGFHDCGG